MIYAKSKTGEKITESYDKLVLATGSRPIIPNLPGKDLKGIHFLKLFQEGQAIDEEFAKNDVKRIAVIGAGYIGTEIAEAAKRRGKEVLLLMQKVLHLLHIMMKSLLKGWMKILPNMELNPFWGISSRV